MKRFSFIEVLEPAISYRKWTEYSKQIDYLEKEPETHIEAKEIANEKLKFNLGIFYRTNRPGYHKELYRDYNPITNRMKRNVRLEKIRKILGSKK